MRAFYWMAIAGLALTGLIGAVALASPNPDVRLGPYNNDRNLAHAFGAPKFFAEVSCSTSSARTAADFTKNQVYLVTCDSDTRIDFGDSTVTATTGEILRAAGADFYFTATDFTRMACIVASGTSKCTLTEMRGAVDTQ